MALIQDPARPILAFVVSTTASDTRSTNIRTRAGILSNDFTVRAFQARLVRHQSAPIKAALLDQTTVAGIGNIYADECLHLARIDPRQPTAGITSVQVRRLHEAIQVVLRDAVDHGGTSFASYVNDARNRETFLARPRLFGRQGQPCVVCGTPIERIRGAGRGTNYCPRCQRMKGTTTAHSPGDRMTAPMTEKVVSSPALLPPRLRYLQQK